MYVSFRGGQIKTCKRLKSCKNNKHIVHLLPERIRELCEKLSEKLDAGKTANHLYQQGAVTKKEFEEIQQLSVDLPTRAAEQLLNIVLSQTEDFLDSFLDSLIKTDQLDVHQWIVLQGVFMLQMFILVLSSYSAMLLGSSPTHFRLLPSNITA